MFVQSASGSSHLLGKERLSGRPIGLNANCGDYLSS